MRIQKPKKKLYYSLRQVVEMVGVSDDLIKQWEKFFPQLKPIRNRAGNRYFLEKDVTLLLYIKDLILEKKLSIEEVKENLKDYRLEKAENNPLKLKQVISEIKMEINEILDILKK